MNAAIAYDTDEAREFFAHKVAYSTGPVEVSQQIETQENITIIDVREQEDYEKGHIPGALNLPQSRWETLEGLNRESVNILYCYSPTCHLAAKAAVQFAEQGFRVMEMDGGFEVWKKNKLEIEK